MARPSKIDRLPAPLREAIGDLRRDGHTIDQILAHLHALGATEIKRSGLGEHIKRLDEVGAELRQEQEIARALIEQIGSEEVMDDKLFRLNVQMLQGVLLKLQLAARGGELELTPPDVAALAKTLQQLASASRSDVERVTRLEKRAAERALRQAEAAVREEARAAKAAGKALTPETILARIRGIYGG